MPDPPNKLGDRHDELNAPARLTRGLRQIRRYRPQRQEIAVCLRSNHSSVSRTLSLSAGGTISSGASIVCVPSAVCRVMR